MYFKLDDAAVSKTKIEQRSPGASIRQALAYLEAEADTYGFGMAAHLIHCASMAIDDESKQQYLA